MNTEKQKIPKKPRKKRDPKPEGAPLTVHEVKQLLVERMLGKYGFKGEPINWPREMKIAAALVKKYGPKFLASFKMDYTVPSLAYFKGKGKIVIDTEFKLWDIKPVEAPSSFELGAIVEKVEAPKKKRNLFDEF